MENLDKATLTESNRRVDTVISKMESKLDVDVKFSTYNDTRAYEDECLVKEAKQDLLRELKKNIANTRMFDNL